MSSSANPPPHDERGRRAQVTRVLQSASAWFAARFAEFATEAEASLERTAEADPQRRIRLLEALARFREQRPALQRALLASLAARSTRLSAPPTARPRPRLELMADDDLAVALAIAPLTRQARQIAAEEWARLEDCLAQVFDPPSDGELWPLDPAEVIAAFREATEILKDFDRDALLILLDGFGASVLAHLPELYRHLLLVFANELGLVPRPPRPVALRAAAGEEACELWNRLERLLGGEDAADAGERVDTPTPDLLRALSLLQRVGEMGASPKARAGEALKTLVLDRLADLRGGRSPRLSARDERGIDLVGMLFDFILRDEAIPERIRLILARLQIPCVKAVLIQPNSLADRSGAPRRLLDLLADSSVGWSLEADRDGRFLAQVEAAVETVRREFEDDLEVFERAIRAFQSFHAGERQRAEAAMQRHLAAFQGRERLRQARAEVGARIAELVGEHPLPPRLRHLLFGPWAHYLVLTILRHGEGSAAAREALGLAERLVAMAGVGTVRPGEEELARLEALLRHGLHAVAVHDSEVEAYASWLRHRLGASASVPAPPEIVPSGEPEPLAPPFVSEAGRERIGAPVSAPAAPSLEEPELGSWWCFRDGDRERRGRLIWKSPLDGRLLFVHQRGAPSLEMDAQSFAAARAEGRAVPLPAGDSLVERALRRIDDTLRPFAGHGR